MKNNTRWLALLLVVELVVILTWPDSSGPVPIPPGDVPPMDVGPDKPLAIAVDGTFGFALQPEPMSTTPIGAGEITYDGDRLLNGEQEQLLLDYMHDYYMSLVDLRPRNPAPHFSAEAADQLASNRAVWEATVAIRAMQDHDLSLTDYRFVLTCSSVSENSDGDLSVRVSEDYVQNFAAFPGVDSEGFNISHTFTLTREGGRWLITSHRQMDTLNYIITGRSFGRSQGGDRSIEIRLGDFLAEMRAATAGRSKQGTVATPTFAHAYDREAAVAYALRWVGERNSAWPAYDRYGGNCQNYTSQALRAGGIPMDIQSPGIWKYYGETPDNLSRAYGRSASWSAAGSFLTYAETNRGYGLVAHADAPFYTGEIGDIIHLGTAESWRHTVMISEVIADESGEVVDYLICSNTADLRNFPVSAYHYSAQQLIKIYGWNV